MATCDGRAAKTVSVTVAVAVTVSVSVAGPIAAGRAGRYIPGVDRAYPLGRHVWREEGTAMLRRMFRSKIHRATITHADLDYEGSCTIDADLMDAAGMLPHEELHVWNVARGTRLVTYALPGARGSGVVCINGAAAHLNAPGELVILATFGEMTEADARAHVPLVVRVDEHNRVIGTERETPGPALPLHLAEKLPGRPS